jgi:hypothetical protein
MLALRLDELFDKGVDLVGPEGARMLVSLDGVSTRELLNEYLSLLERFLVTLQSPEQIDASVKEISP